MLVLVKYPENRNQKSYISKVLSRYERKQVVLVDCTEDTIKRLEQLGAEVIPVEQNKNEYIQFFYDLFVKNAKRLKGHLNNEELEKVAKIEEELDIA